ncbi:MULTISPECIES: aldo/keto reductase [unclassified Pseudactinotalea]|uniref:aldo/keto reductase n=1 Tax=Micrococcales TaxID=85006 RepID=UPI003C79B84A
MAAAQTGSVPEGDTYGRQGFGSMRLSEDDAGTADRDPVAVLNAALDLGVTMIDTADAYQNEELVGRAIRTRRDDVVLASKFGLVRRDDLAAGFEARADPAYVRSASEASLQRLGVEAIDLYYLHLRSETVPIEDTVGAMAELVDQGKIRAIGLSNVTAEDLRRAHAVHPVAALQEQWSLVQRGIEDELLPTAAELGVVVVAHSPTGQGLLHAQPQRRTDGPVTAGLRAALGEIATGHDATIGQVALAWVHHRQQEHGVRVVPLPGTASMRHLHANVAAADLRLSATDLRRLETVTTAAKA